MSNKKRRTREQKIKYQQTKLLKIKELEKLRMEIINIEKEIKKQKKNKRIKNLKIYGSTFRRIVMPVVLVTGICLGTGQLLNIGLPIKKDKLSTVKEINVDYETDKKFNINEQYIHYFGVIGPKTQSSKIEIYKDDKVEYKAEIKNNEQKVIIYDNLVKNDLKGVLEQFDYFEENSLIEKIIQIDSGYIIKCNLNIINEEDKFYVKESEELNDAVNMAYYFFVTMGSISVIKFNKFFDDITNINSNYQIISIKDLKKQLSDKKVKYLKKKKEV